VVEDWASTRRSSQCRVRCLLDHTGVATIFKVPLIPYRDPVSWLLIGVLTCAQPTATLARSSATAAPMWGALRVGPLIFGLAAV